MRRSACSRGERALGGVLFVVPGLAIAWLCAAWLAERDARIALDERASELVAGVDAGGARADRLLARQRELEADLLASARESQAKNDFLARLARERERGDTAREGVDAVSPDLVRSELARLRALNHALREAGLARVRVFDVERYAKNALVGMRLVVLGDDGVLEGSYLAERATFELDRSRGTFAVVLAGAVEIWKGKRSPRVERKRLVFEPRDPRALETGFAGLVDASGSWPDPVPRRPVVRVPDATLALWRDRLATFLALLPADSRLSLQALAGLAPRGFAGVDLNGYSEKGLLERHIHAEQCEVWVDDDSDAVELRLYDGYVDRPEGRVAFAKRWFRFPLAGLARADAERVLTGFVRRYRSLPGRR